MSPRRAKAVSGRAGDDPAAALREHLIDVTEGLLAGTPIATITTRDIARAAGVSDGVLYNYFEDKTALILAALVRRYKRLARRFYAALPEPGTNTVERNLEAYAGGFLDLLDDSLPTLAGLLSEPLLLHRLLEQIHLDELGPQNLVARLDGYLAEEKRLGRLGDVDVSPVGTLLMGAALVLVLSAQFGPAGNEADVAAQLRAGVATILRGLA
jgi:AcrR family transcriptional regulator